MQIKIYHLWSSEPLTQWTGSNATQRGHWSLFSCHCIKNLTFAFSTISTKLRIDKMTKRRVLTLISITMSTRAADPNRKPMISITPAVAFVPTPSSEIRARLFINPLLNAQQRHIKRNNARLIQRHHHLHKSMTGMLRAATVKGN